MELSIYSIEGKETGKKARLNDAIFSIEPNDHAIYLDVKQHLANGRQGTHKSKQRNEVHGSTRKLHKQKGTGGSRKGSIKNPLYRGGGRVFGPEPRDYSFKLNKKLKQLARKSALSYKAKEGAITILDSFKIDTPKTKSFESFLKNFEANTTKSLLVLPDRNLEVYLSSRNIASANVITASELNTYEVLDANKLFILEESLTTIDNLLSK
ncbi:MAG: 50S ribosomal protein L4 [Flavobacteriales bacterium]|nr:50S ribosomal protein L4 [Flavobacteriales bacterium]